MKVFPVLLVALALASCRPKPPAAVSTPPTPAPTPAAYVDFARDLRAFVDAGSKLNALSTQGVVFATFDAELAVVRGRFDTLESAWQSGENEDARRDFSESLSAWGAAQQLWSEQLKGKKMVTGARVDELLTLYPELATERLDESLRLPITENVRLLLGRGQRYFVHGRALVMGVGEVPPIVQPPARTPVAIHPERPVTLPERPPAFTIAPPTPAPPRLTAAGMWYLTETINLAHSDGVFGFPPGTLVYEKLRTDDGVMVRADQIEFMVQPHQITNNIDAGERLKFADRSAQAKNKAAAENNKPMPATPKIKSATPRPAKYISPLERGAYKTNGRNQ